MRLLICFYIVLGLFKLFQGLTHGVHSNAAYGILGWKRETKVKWASWWKLGSCTTGKGRDSWCRNILFLLNGLPARLESPSSGHLLYHGLFPCVSYRYRGTWAIGWKILEEKTIPRSFLLRVVQVLRRKHFYPGGIIHPWSLLNTSGISGPSHAVFWLYFKVLAPVNIGMNIPDPSSWKIPLKENKLHLTDKVLKWLWLKWWI